MNGLTRFFLVLLRLAIGWHFLFEGIEKVESVQKGPTETSRPFSSAAYLNEASGPLGDLMRRQIGDPDEIALEELTVQPLRSDQDPGRTPPRSRVPPALEKEWDIYFERFSKHYKLDPRDNEEADKVEWQHAQAVLDQAKDQAVRWLLEGKKEVERSFPTTTVRLTLTTGQRVEEYRQKLKEIKRILQEELPAFDRDVEKQKLRNLKSEAARLRVELLAELNQPMKDALQAVLTDEQKKLGPVPDAVADNWREWSRLQWIDAITRWGLVVVGLGLLVGLLTRTCCIAGALFLLMLYLTVAPFPWLPEPARVEGHYYFVNKNLIEMLALLALATTASGRWLGLDGLLRFLNPRNWKAGAGRRRTG